MGVLEFMVVLLLVLDMARERLLVDMVVTMVTPLDPSAMPTLRGSATRGLSRTLARSPGRSATQSPVKCATPLPMRSVSLWRSGSLARCVMMLLWNTAIMVDLLVLLLFLLGLLWLLDIVLVLLFLLVMVLDMVSMVLELDIN